MGGWRTSLHNSILLVFRFFQQTLGGKIIAQGQGAEQLPRRLPREPHKVSRRLTGLLDYRSYCIKNSPTGQGHLIGKEGHIPPSPGREENAMGGMQKVRIPNSKIATQHGGCNFGRSRSGVSARRHLDAEHKNVVASDT